MPYAEVNGIKMFYKEQGSGPPLLCIMGLGGNADWWSERFVFEMSEEFRLILPDNRGAGRSDCPEEQWTIETNAADLKALLDELKIEKANVFGISMGGMIAQIFAIKYPEKVEKLVLGCTFCGVNHGIPSRASLWDDSSLEVRARKTAELIFCEETIKKYPKVIDLFVERYLKLPTSREGFFRQLNAILNFDSFNYLKKITAPTLIMTGMEDQILHHENSDILQKHIPNSRMIKFSPAGHGFFEEVPEVLDILKSFFKN